MADGRLFTDYRPRCDVNNQQSSDSFAYRQMLISNASDLMAQERAQAYRRGSCAPCAQPWDQGTMLPERDMTSCTARSCTTSRSNDAGIGTGREYASTPEYKASAKAEHDAFVRANEDDQASACKLCAGSK